MKHLFFGALLFTSISAFAADFCSNPVDAICEGNPNRGGARQAKANSYIEKEVGETMAEVVQAFQIPFWVMNDEKSIVEYMASQPEQRREAIIWNLYQVAMTKLGAFYAHKEENLFNDNVKVLLANFHQTIDRVFPAATNTSNSSFHARVKEINILTSSIIQKKVEKRDPTARSLQLAFIGACGVFGSNQNAFAFTSEEGIRYLLVCPGWALGKIDAKETAFNNFVNFLFVSSHEIGHHLDAGEYPTLFKDYLEKFAVTYGSALADPPRGPYQQFTKFTYADRVTSHAKEITADVWASENLATYLTSAFKQVVFQSRLDIIRESFGALCDSGDEGIHPDGLVRASIVGFNPSVRAAMSCVY